MAKQRPLRDIDQAFQYQGIGIGTDHPALLPIGGDDAFVPAAPGSNNTAARRRIVTHGVRNSAYHPNTDLVDSRSAASLISARDLSISAGSG